MVNLHVFPCKISLWCIHTDWNFLKFIAKRRNSLGKISLGSIKETSDQTTGSKWQISIGQWAHFAGRLRAPCHF